jgi:hypothetical protein
MEMAETPLENVPGWTEIFAARMKEAWVTTAEQVVALGATSDGLRSLAEQLQVSEVKARQLIEAARAELSPEVRMEMESPVDTSGRGLGVLPPRSQDEVC